MNVSSVSVYQPYIEKITSQLDSQSAAAQRSIDELHRLSASYEVKISDYGMIQSDLSNLQSAAQKISGIDAFSLYSAKSTDSAILTASAQKNAPPGTYNIRVSQLAQGETLVSAARQNPSAAIGSGSPSTINFQFVNGASQSVTIDKSNNTLPGIAASINQADIGISASVAFNGSAFQLVLNGPSGSSNAFNIGGSGDEAVTHLLSYSNGATNNAMTQTMAAQDSLGSINGTPFTGYSNVVKGIAGGLTLNLGKTGDAAITVATDMVQITSAVQSFVDTYNRVQSDLATYQTGELSGDRTLPALSNQLSDDLKSGSNPSTGSLEQIGITRNQDGALAFDAKVFQDVYAQDPAGVARLFTDNGTGLADQISKQLQNVLQPSGGISSTIDQLLTKIQDNQQMESSIEYNSIQDLQSSAHQYAQQLAMMIVTDIVNQFMQGVSPQTNRAPEKTSGMSFPVGMGTGSSNTWQSNRLNITPGVSSLETLMNNLATQYNEPSPVLNTGNQA
ncbi:flagellar hook-associated protein 2 [Ferrigenium kumadai]|uniref:Flagellar hook-associated protein 2 n=1 Tax=Ferrigenium kumadai TaxID=1682490 RepID=A0AAN1SZ70_9PROT|nr:flagellar filament capping protein FliD [Ferrigenium kumadai]BBI99790.1 flagellar hook-associated protein 2 [Ferrigenium kumadai]